MTMWHHIQTAVLIALAAGIAAVPAVSLTRYIAGQTRDAQTPVLNDLGRTV